MTSRVMEAVRNSLRKRRRLRKARKRLGAIEPIPCNTTHLGAIAPERLREIFLRHETEASWADAQDRASHFHIPDGSGGVNPGDRRAIFYLIAALKPRSVLEIGTHIGASTLHLALALHLNQTEQPGEPGSRAKLFSVDALDVNDPFAEPWIRHGTEHSPVEMLRQIGLDHLVEFVIGRSIPYLEGATRGFDFIFLDGDHDPETVYQEIPRALSALNEEGVILLHDYFPHLKPLWTDGSVIPGPWLATRRLVCEGAGIAVTPLGELPWPTKLGSQVTSLALLVNAEA